MTFIFKYFHNVLLKFPTLYKHLQESISSLPFPRLHEKLVTLRYNAMLEKKSKSDTFCDIQGKRLLLDVTSIYLHDGATGIQRVTKNILYQLLKDKPADYTAIPIYIHNQKLYYPKNYAKMLLKDNGGKEADSPVAFHEGDIFIGLDYNPYIDRALLDEMKRLGITVKFLLHDLLPLKFPYCFERRRVYAFKHWLETVCKYDGVICISNTVASELNGFLQNGNFVDLTKFKITRFCEGVGIGGVTTTLGLPAEAESIFKQIDSKVTFIMVGKIEPRKRHTQVLSAFELLWAAGIDANLVIVGAEGWLARRLVRKITLHTELNKRLFWLKHISDEYLREIYKRSTCLIFASIGEGFGLPIVEAARHGLPIIARDLPVFRETAKDNICYFVGDAPADLAGVVKNWMELYKNGSYPTSNNIRVLSWKESAAQFLIAVLG